MSSIKEYFFEVQQENCIEWIRQQYGIEIDPDEDEEHWAELAGEYSAMLEAGEAEFEWLNRHSHSEFFHEFSAELATASSMLTLGSSQHADTLSKLVYAHVVTLMEALISSVVRKLIVSEQILLMNLVAGYKKLSGITVTLKQIAEEPKVVEVIVLKALSELSFHNVATINQVLHAMFGEHMKGLGLNEIGRICSKRHDIVHRNGKTVEDQPIELTSQEVQQAIRTISEFAEDLKSRIYNAFTAKDAAEF
ncbi:hypothetical protein ACDZ94_04160 [Pseudomonas sp. UBT]|uniref:hypothetical protein n=1 Tax=Pseudomonas sp. UBT TaxID=3239198 RepID=UPI003D8028F6